MAEPNGTYKVTYRTGDTDRSRTLTLEALDLGPTTEVWDRTKGSWRPALTFVVPARLLEKTAPEDKRTNILIIRDRVLEVRRPGWKREGV